VVTDAYVRRFVLILGAVVTDAYVRWLPMRVSLHR